MLTKQSEKIKNLRKYLNERYGHIVSDRSDDFEDTLVYMNGMLDATHGLIIECEDKHYDDDANLYIRFTITDMESEVPDSTLIKASIFEEKVGREIASLWSINKKVDLCLQNKKRTDRLNRTLFGRLILRLSRKKAVH